MLTDYYNETAALPYTLKVVFFVILNGSQKSFRDLKYSIMLMLSKIDEFLMIIVLIFSLNSEIKSCNLNIIG